MSDVKSLLLDRDALRQTGIDIPWAEDVKGFVLNTPGRAEHLIVYLEGKAMKTLSGNSDEVKRQITVLKDHREESAGKTQ